MGAKTKQRLWSRFQQSSHCCLTRPIPCKPRPPSNTARAAPQTSRLDLNAGALPRSLAISASHENNKFAGFVSHWQSCFYYRHRSEVWHVFMISATNVAQYDNFAHSKKISRYSRGQQARFLCVRFFLLYPCVERNLCANTFLMQKNVQRLSHISRLAQHKIGRERILPCAIYSQLAVVNLDSYVYCRSGRQA